MFSLKGYADELKEKGMVKENLKGEDISKIRRQQFEVSLPLAPYNVKVHI